MKKSKQKQMKEFDIEKAKAGAPVCTRDGRPVRIICWDFQEYGQQEADEKFPIIALVKEDKGERAYAYRESGKCMVNKDDELVMAPVKREGWVCLYKTDDGKRNIAAEPVYPSLESAKSAVSNNKKEYGDDAVWTPFAYGHVEWEE